MRAKIVLALLLFLSASAFSQEKVWQQNFSGSAKHYTLGDMALSADSALLLLAITDEVGRIKVTVLDTAGNHIKSNSFGRIDCSTWNYRATAIAEFNDKYIVGVSGQSSCDIQGSKLLILSKQLNLLNEVGLGGGDESNTIESLNIDSGLLYCTYRSQTDTKVKILDTSLTVTNNSFPSFEYTIDEYCSNGNCFFLNVSNCNTSTLECYITGFLVDSNQIDTTFVNLTANNTLKYYPGDVSKTGTTPFLIEGEFPYVMWVEDDSIQMTDCYNNKLHSIDLSKENLTNRVASLNTSGVKDKYDRIYFLVAEKLDTISWRTSLLIYNPLLEEYQLMSLHDSIYAPLVRTQPYNNKLLATDKYVYAGVNIVDTSSASRNESFTITKIKIADPVNSLSEQSSYRDKLKLKVYPNPTDGNLWIETNNFNKLYFSVFDQQGRVIVPKQKLTSQKISLDALSKGLYHVTFFDEVDNSYKSEKILLK